MTRHNFTLFVSLKFFVMSALPCNPKTSGLGINGIAEMISRLFNRLGRKGTAYTPDSDNWKLKKGVENSFKLKVFFSV